MGRLRQVKALGGVMVLKSPNPRVMKILTLAGMERFMEIDGVKGAEK
jgi:anti-anti-sigma regulatory factor